MKMFSTCCGSIVSSGPSTGWMSWSIKGGLVLSAVALASAGIAQDTNQGSADRLVSLTVYGDEPCPAGASNEIVVCARAPESERYRIPRALRTVKSAPPARAWASRVHVLEDAARASRPNSCSPVGTGGQTGCFAHALERWFAERR